MVAQHRIHAILTLQTSQHRLHLIQLIGIDILQISRKHDHITMLGIDTVDGLLQDMHIPARE